MEILSPLADLVENRTDKDLNVKCKTALEAYIEENESTFFFANQIEDGEYNKLMTCINELVSCDHMLTSNLLTIARLFSRDKSLVAVLDIDLHLNIFTAVYEKDCVEGTNDYISKVEALKFLCNWVYHSGEVRRRFIEKSIMKNMIDNVNFPLMKELGDVMFYQIRLLFLVSGLEVSERGKMLEQGMLRSLTYVLNEAMRSYLESPCEDNLQKIITECLKALFNVTVELANVTSDAITVDCAKLVITLRSMLLSLHPFEQDKADILSDISHLFLNVQKGPSYCLIPEWDSQQENYRKFTYPKCYEFEGGGTSQNYPSKKGKFAIKGGDPPEKKKYDMTAVIVMLEALEKRSSVHQYAIMKEKCMPLVSAFSYICRINPVIRKFVKKEVLPHLKCSKIHPEHMKGLRGNLVRLMQSVDVPLKNMAADFIYVLCKENVRRLVKYVGYGNSAGFLASRGLMNLSTNFSADGDYSSDELSSEDEDMDIMTGATAVPKKNVFADLTEEEKDIEVEKLMKLTQRLQELDVVKPMQVRDDGKLVEIDLKAPSQER